MDRVRMRCVTVVLPLLLVCALSAAAQDIRTVVSASHNAGSLRSVPTKPVGTGPELQPGVVPRDLAVDARGTLYIAVDESSSQTNARGIFMLEPDGTLKPFTGEADRAVLGDGGLASDADGNVFIADHGAIRRIDAGTGVTTTLASGEPLSQPMSLALDRGGNLYIADSVAGAVFVLSAKTGELELLAHVASPGALAVGPSGANLYVASLATAQVFRIDTRTHAISLVAGTGRRRFPADLPAKGVPATGAQLVSPGGIAVDAAGNLFIADAGRHVIYRVDAHARTISRIAGSGNPGYSGDGGPAVEAELNAPGPLALDRAGNLFFVDQGNGAVRVVEHAGVADQPSNVTLTCPGGGTACFNFAAQPIAGTEGPQTILLSNNSGVTLVINNISFVGGNAVDFAQTNFCTQPVPMGSTCNINVTFTPLATGPLSSTLTVVDSGSSPQRAPVSGIGDDYELGVAMGGSLTQTITAGATANYSLVITQDAQNIFAGTVTLACTFPSTVPPLTTCSVPPSKMVTAGTPAPFTVSLMTTKRGSAPGPVRQFPALPWGVVAVFLAAIAILIAGAGLKPAPVPLPDHEIPITRQQSSIAIRLLPAFVLLVVFATLSGCHHHSRAAAAGTTAGTYQVNIVGNAQNATRAVTLMLIVQ